MTHTTVEFIVTRRIIKNCSHRTQKLSISNKDSENCPACDENRRKGTKAFDDHLIKEITILARTKLDIEKD